MLLGGLDADAKPSGHHLVGQAIGDQLQHFQLAGCQREQGRAAPMITPCRCPDAWAGRRQGWAEIGPALLDDADRVAHHAWRFLLGQIADGSVLDRPLDIGIAAVRGEHDHLGIGAVLDDHAGGLEAAEQRHLDVHQDDRWTQRSRPIDRLAAVRRFADDGDARIIGEVQTQTGADHVVIIGQQQGQGVHGGSFVCVLESRSSCATRQRRADQVADGGVPIGFAEA